MTQVRAGGAGPRHAATTAKSAGRWGAVRRSGMLGLGTAGVAVGLAGAVVNGLAYVVPLLGARHLTPDGLSALATALAIGAIATVPGLGLQTAIAVRRARDGTFGNAGRITAMTAVAAAGSLLAATPLIMGTLHLSAAVPLILAITAAAVVVASRWLGELQGSQRFGRLAVGMMLLAVGRYGGVIAGLVSHVGVTGSLLMGGAVALACLPALAALERRAPDDAAAAGILAGAQVSDEVGATVPAGRLRAWDVLTAGGATLAMLVASYADLILARHLLPPADSGSYAVGAVLTKGALWAPQVVTVVALPRLARGSRRALIAAVGVVAAAGVVLVLFSWFAGGLVVGLAGGPAYAGLSGYAAEFTAVGAFYAVVFVLVSAEIARGARWPGAPLWVGLLGLVVGTRLLNPPTLGGVLSVSVCTAAATAIAMLGVVTFGRRLGPMLIDDARRAGRRSVRRFHSGPC
jgi:O-antigen/teichoic acid export membrane protein